MKRSSTHEQTAQDLLATNAASGSIKKAFVLPKNTLDRFERVCDELELASDDLMEIALEVFLSSKVWRELDREKPRAN